MKSNPSLPAKCLSQFQNMPLKGQRTTQATKDRISASRKGHPAWNKGIPQSDEVKVKISASRKGQPAWNKNRSMPENVKRKIRKTKLIPETKFKTLYERLELKFRSNFSDIDRWLLRRIPNIQTVNCLRGKETLPTHIRHCIHHAEHPLRYSQRELSSATTALSSLKL